MLPGIRKFIFQLCTTLYYISPKVSSKINPAHLVASVSVTFDSFSCDGSFSSGSASADGITATSSQKLL